MTKFLSSNLELLSLEVLSLKKNEEKEKTMISGYEIS